MKTTQTCKADFVELWTSEAGLTLILNLVIDRFKMSQYMRFVIII